MGISKRRLYKTITTILVVALTIVSSVPTFAADNNEVETEANSSTEIVLAEDGFEYCIKTIIDESGNKTMVITSNKDDTTYIETIDSTKGIIQVNEFDGTDLVSSRNVNFSNDETELTPGIQPLAYGSKVVEKSEGKYWYQNGTKTVSGKTKSFVKIGCVATYELNYTDASATAQKAFDNYTANLRKANSSYGKFTSACYALDLSAAAVGALILANIAFPPSVIITIIGGGATVAMVSNYFDYKDYFDSMKEWYTKAKVYGKKL